MNEPVQFNDRAERLLFGAVIIGSNTLAMIALAFVKIPAENATVVGQIAGGLSAALGIIAANTWKTTSTERQQAQTLQTLATSAAAPVTETTTRTVERNDVGTGTAERRPVADEGVAGPGPADGGAEGVGGASADAIRPGDVPRTAAGYAASVNIPAEPPGVRLG